MPVYINKQGYTLKEGFVAGGGIYTQSDVDALALHIRFKSAPTDSSVNGITVSYTGTPTISNQLIPNSAVCRVGELPAANFPTTSEFAAVAASSHLNFSAGKPFSIAGWVKTDTFGNKSIVSMPNVANSDVGWTLFIKAAALSFTLNGTGGGAINCEQMANKISISRWNHFAVTYDGSNSYAGITLYLNGEKAITRDLSAGTFTALDADGSRALKVGIGWNGVVNPLKDTLSEVAIWKKELKKSSVTALYHSTAGHYIARSGIISLPNRVRLREVDSLTGSYPTHLRTTGFSGSLKGNGKSVFDDTTTQTFVSTPDAIFPIVNSEENLKNSILTNLIASPNQNSNLIGQGIAGPFLSTQGLRKHIDYGMPNEPFNETRLSFLSKETHFYASGTSGSIYSGFSSPLRDKIAIPLTVNNQSEKTITRYNTKDLPGHDEEGLFPSSHYTTGFYYYNFKLGTWEDKGLYSNLVNKMFYVSDDPVTANSAFLGQAIPRWDGSVLGGWGVGTIPILEPLTKMQQFKMSDHTGVIIDSKADSMSGSSEDPYSLLTSSLGYDKIGSPTITGLAPANERYHATGSQTMKLSDYIARPFLFEKAVLEIPVIVNRLRGHVKQYQIGNRFYDSSRDIDNYTFFLYRQQKSSSPRDSGEDKISSRRMLVASGCASFYNSNAFSGRVPYEIRSKGLPHGPAFSYDFNIPSVIDSANPPPPIPAFTGTIRIEMEAAIGNGQPLGGSRFPLLSITSGSALGLGFRSIVTQDFWCGGVENYSGTFPYNKSYSSDQIMTPINTENFVADAKNTVVGELSPYGIGQLNTPSTCSMGPNNVSMFWSERSLLPLFKGTSLWNHPRDRVGTNSSNEYGKLVGNKRNSLGILGYTNMPPRGGSLSFRQQPTFFGPYSSSRTSPFLFLPGDELVLGIDAGISMLQASGSAGNAALISADCDAAHDLGYYSASAATIENFGCMSGSFMKILTGEAKLTLFGSEVKENHEMLLLTNQNLTSEAIHEAIGTERVLDQFETMSRLDLSSSYVDRYIIGKVVSSMNKTNAATISGDGQFNWGADGIQSNSAQGRRIMGFHSKRYVQRKLVAYPGVLKTSTNITESPFSDRFTGSPPWGVFNAVGNSIAKDPHFITPGLAGLAGPQFGSLQRFCTHQSENEIFYDSMAPEITNIIARSSNINFIKPRLHNYTEAQSLPMVEFSPTSSLDYVYRTNPPRLLDQNYILRLHADGEGPGIGASAIYWDFANTKGTPAQSTERLRKFALFNRGMNIMQGKAADNPSQVTRRFSYTPTGSYGPKYGMISPTIKKSNAIFRIGSYGQFRDMLEQRKDTKYYGTINMDTRSMIGDSPIQVKFVRQGDGVTLVDPYETDSTNYWHEYSSSMPYNESVSSSATGFTYAFTGPVVSPTTVLELLGSGPGGTSGGSTSTEDILDLLE